MRQDTANIKYIAYSRKSTESEDRQMLSLDDQKREINVLRKELSSLNSKKKELIEN